MKLFSSPVAPRIRRVAIGGLFAATASIRAQTLTEFPLPSPASSPAEIAAGPDGNLWFTIPSQNSIARISTDGQIAEFRLSTSGQPREITAGPDGNLWFVENDPPRIARITPSGSIVEYGLSDPGSRLMCLTARLDGLWFGNSSTAGEKVGRISVNGAFTEFPICASNFCGRIVDIVAGADGNLWFTLYEGRQIGRMSPSGEVIVFPVPSGARPFSITRGPDGNVWFTANVQSETSLSVAHVGRITADGSISEFVLSTPDLAAIHIATGSDGRLWFTASINHAPGGPDRISRISTDGQYWELTLGTYGPGGFVSPWGITSGPDGNIWFTAWPGSIGRISLGSEGRVPRMPVVRGPRRDPR